MSLPRFAPAEPLEDRIAPAILFLNGLDGAGTETPKVSKADGTTATVELDLDAATKVGATFAIKLAAYDSLVLDLNDNHAVDAGETVLVSVSGGNALVFVTDLGASPDGHFDLNELTGLAVSDGFKATIGTDVNGSIATVLNDNSSLAITSGTLFLQPDSIDSLTITGKVTGNIFTGDSLSNVRISGPVSGNLATGTAINLSDQHLKAADFQFNGSTTLPFNFFSAEDNKAGGSISNVILAQGAHNLIAGNGGEGAAGVGGKGGSISNVSITLTGNEPVWLKTGVGGQSSVSSGGEGGSVSNVTIKYTVATQATSNLQIETGGGGKAVGSLSGNGGRGGSISEVTILTTGDFTGQSIALVAGPGATSTGLGVGGNGGSIVNVDVQALGSTGGIKTVSFAAGQGGAAQNSSGGIGGSLEGLVLNLGLDATGNVELLAGNGANGTGKLKGGRGGSIINPTVITNGNIGGILRLIAGSGGDLSGAGAGGAGGAITAAHLQILGSSKTVQNVTLLAGTGGDSTGAAGGLGGAFTDSTILFEPTIGSASVNTAVEIGSGAGGLGKTVGGTGGALKANTISFRNAVITTQDGPLVNNLPGPRIAKPISIHTGAGGDLQSFATAKSIAASGGAISGLQILQAADITAGFTIRAADGGDADGASAGRGGRGGAISDFSFTSLSGANTDLTLAAGNGGIGANGKGDGGIGGTISKTSFTALGEFHSLTVQGGNGGDSEGGRGGTGGGISTLHTVVGNVTGAVKILAGSAGDASGVSATAGGSIADTIVINHGLVTGGVQLTAGAGGTATSSGTAGTGGGISHVLVANYGGIATQTAPAVSLAVTSGAGGAAGTSGTGGAGGTISSLTLNSTGTLPTATITGGIGGEGGSSSGAGGAGGKILGLSLNVIDTGSLIVRGGTGGESNGTSKGGAGGSIDGVTGDLDVASFRAGTGGVSASGTGGTGGGARNFNLDAVGRFVRVIAAGDGGKGVNGGAGGSLSNLVVPGDIGDFTKPFDVVSDLGMGGLVAGHKGDGGGKATNGSITGVTATRIAAMLAGTPAANSIDYDNGVYKISKITASVLGADVNGNSVFDWTDGTAAHTFQPDDSGNSTDGDTAIDGLILVRKGGFSVVPVTPLKLQGV